MWARLVGPEWLGGGCIDEAGCLPGCDPLDDLRIRHDHTLQRLRTASETLIVDPCFIKENVEHGAGRGRVPGAARRRAARRRRGGARAVVGADPRRHGSGGGAGAVVGTHRQQVSAEEPCPVPSAWPTCLVGHNP